VTEIGVLGPAGWPMEFFILLVFCGLVFGSFLNVCIYRIPLGKSVVSPRSACPSCGTAIAWYGNVPVLSWLVLRGRCAHCRAPISVRYPFVEALNAGLWVAVAIWFGPSITALLLLPFVSILLVLFFTDWDHHLLPDRLTFPLAIVGLIVAPFNPRLDFGYGILSEGGTGGRMLAALLGAVLGYGIFFTLAFVWKVFFDKDAMGGGDLKMMLGVGAFLGMGGVITTIFLASILGTVLALPFLLTGRWAMTRQLPFGCFLAPAALISAFTGIEALRWYLGIITYT